MRESSHTPGIQAALYGKVEEFKVLLEADPSILQQMDEQQRIPSIIVAENGNLTLFKVCVAHDRKLFTRSHRRDDSPASIAIKKNNIELFEYFVQHEPNVLKWLVWHDFLPRLLKPKNKAFLELYSRTSLYHYDCKAKTRKRS